MRIWLSQQTDEGGVMWGVLCCWFLVAGNIILIHLHVPVFYVVPFDVFAVPLIVTLSLWIYGNYRR